MSSICPYLYRDREGRFRCEVTGNAVDPGLMPCLFNFKECPFYVSATKAQAKPAVEAPPEGAPTATVTVEGVVERVLEEGVKAAEERGIEEEVVEEVSRMIKAAEELAVNLNEKWKEYEDNARRLVKMWEETSMSARHALEAISSAIELYEKIIENLETLLKSGRISEKAYEELKSEAQSNLEKYKSLKNDLESSFKNAERLVIPHIQRVKVAEARPELGKLRLSLMKLEQMYKEGKVSRETYERLKKELESRIRWLEQLVGETA